MSISANLQRRTHNWVVDLDEAVFVRLSAARPTRPSRSWSSWFLLGISIAMMGLFAAMVGYGVYLLAFGWIGAKVIGLGLVLFGLELRPRVARLRGDFGAVERAEAPQLFGIIDEIGDVLGAPVVDSVHLDERFNAWCGRFGLRRRAVLGLGLPLWGALGPDSRTALLGHELGHLVNGDPEQGFITQPALLTFARLAAILDPRGLIVQHRVTGFSPQAGAVAAAESISVVVARILLIPLRSLATGVHLGVSALASRDHQRAEVFADALAVEVGGSDGAYELMSHLLWSDSALTAVRRSALTSHDPSDWCEATRVALAGKEALRAKAEQTSSVKRASLLGSHPPPGLRSRLVAAWPQCDGAVAIEPERYQAADAELRQHYERVTRALRRGA